jgi:hypothetical protein
MEGGAPHHDDIPRSDLRVEAAQHAIGASSPDQTYDAIRWALTQLRDDLGSLPGPIELQLAGVVVLQDGKLRVEPYALGHSASRRWVSSQSGTLLLIRS